MGLVKITNELHDIQRIGGQMTTFNNYLLNIAKKHLFQQKKMFSYDMIETEHYCEYHIITLDKKDITMTVEGMLSTFKIPKEFFCQKERQEKKEKDIQNATADFMRVEEYAKNELSTEKNYEIYNVLEASIEKEHYEKCKQNNFIADQTLINLGVRSKIKQEKILPEKVSSKNELYPEIKLSEIQNYFLINESIYGFRTIDYLAEIYDPHIKKVTGFAVINISQKDNIICNGKEIPFEQIRNQPEQVARYLGKFVEPVYDPQIVRLERQRTLASEEIEIISATRII